MKRVRIELKRVQTYLFEVPRLRAMLGANAAVGEFFRGRTPDAPEAPAGLPDLLPTPSAALRGFLEDHQRLFPPAVAEDPLRDASGASVDDPRAAFASKGILAQDGGHFDVLLDDEQVEGFRREAQRLVRERLPGVRSEVRVGPVEGEGSEPTTCSEAVGVALPVLPHFEVCELKGSGPAQTTRELGDTEYKVALDTAQRIDDGARFTRGDTRDVIGLLQGHEALRQHGRTPRDLNELCGRGYLAVLHADGNALGRRQKQVLSAAKEAGKTGLELEAEVQALFHGMRVAFRSSLVEALDRTFGMAGGKRNDQPRRYQVLMLGGDDLLLICRAESAIPFLVNYAAALEGHEDIPGGPITIGAGLVISRPSVPFARLHELAETLASSAKRLHREEAPSESVVDWMVFSGSWAGDPIARRRRSSLELVGKDRLVLSGRPLRILGEGLQSLEGLHERARHLSERIEREREDGDEGAARSQLRRLVEQLGDGPLAAELAFGDLPSSTRIALEEAGLDGPWQLKPKKRGTWLSLLPDLIEVFEIPRLGRAGGGR